MWTRDPQKGGRHLPWLLRIEMRGDCAVMRVDSWRKIPQPNMFHVDTKKLSAYAEIFICMQIKLPRGRDYLHTNKNSGYADKFWGHFVMFPRLFMNKNKICRYEYTKEQARTKKFPPIICVFAYLSIPQRNHSLTPHPPYTYHKSIKT